MAKGFLEVFPTLNIAEPLKELLALAEVEKVTSARDRSSIRVYMKSTQGSFINKISMIWNVELKTSCFQINRSLLRSRKNTDCQDSIRLKSF